MSTFPSLTGKKIITILKKQGFKVIRIKGSHHFLRHPNGNCIVIPVHSGEIIGKGLLNKILKECEITKQDFQKLI